MLVELILIFIVLKANCYRIVWDNTADLDLNNIDMEGKGTDELRMPNWFFIFPGTKWCGAGNIADNDSDYGVHRDTDKCCKNHDYCPDIISGFETKHNLTNPSFYTRLNCQCDQEFYTCLKSVNSITSNQIGQIYFTALGTQCYKEDYPINGCNKYTFFPKIKCIDYVLNDAEEKKYQWFDLPNF